MNFFNNLKKINVEIKTANDNLLKLSNLKFSDEVKIPKNECSKFSISKIISGRKNYLKLDETPSHYIVKKLRPININVYTYRRLNR